MVATSSAPSVDAPGDGPDLLTQVQVCRRLGISDDTWMRWRKAGRVPAPVALPSGRLKWRQQDIDRLAGAPQDVSRARRYFVTARVSHVPTVKRGASVHKVTSRHLRVSR